MKIDSFIKRLSATNTERDADNFYKGRTKASRLKRENLGLYLSLMKQLKPSAMLVAEAPGFNGAKHTGVPFSSERLLLDNSHPLFGVDKGFRTLTVDNLRSENSARMVWDEIGGYSSLPLIWNIFPFHPFRKGNEMSNRAPRKGEIEQGKTFIAELIDIFDIKRIGAVGRKAEVGLMEMKLEQQISYIRHPSYGGKEDFIRGVRELMHLGII